MRPALKVGLLALWRDRETVQIGIDPRRAVALTGMGSSALVLSLLDGSRDRDQVLTAAREQGVPEAVTSRILTLLAMGGVLDDFPAAAMRALRQDQRQLLTAELAATSLAWGHSDAGATALARRSDARIQVCGTGRVAASLVEILTASGLGGVSALAGRDEDGVLGTGAGGTAPARTVASSGAASGDAASGTAVSDRPTAARMARTARAVRAGRGQRPDLAILIGYQDPQRAARLVRAGVPHLAVTAQEAIGVVGPLVRPGQTACLRCLDLTRASLDPAWPLLLAQLVSRRLDPGGCAATLAAAVAAQAAAQALAFIDRIPAAGPAENGTLELVLPGWQWQRRTWPRHQACGCSTATSGERQWGHE